MRKIWGVIAVAVLVVSCSAPKEEQIVSIQYTDRNGFKETISSPDRLKQYQQVDFLAAQPYKQVVRVFKNEEGIGRSIATAYHANGLLKQYLEIAGGRARGYYREWFPSGLKKLEAFVMEGAGDLSPESALTWMFDGTSRVWNEQGMLVAEIKYSKGKLQGDSLYFHPNGQLKQIASYVQGCLHGTLKNYDTHGVLISAISYDEGLHHGPAQYFPYPSFGSAEEWYEKGKLLRAVYRNDDGDVLSEIINGSGIQTVYSDGGTVKKTIEYQEGSANGAVVCWNGSYVTSKYVTKDGLKNGEEIIYYPNSTTPKLSMMWKEGAIHGITTTWYQTGGVESRREWRDNALQGLAFAWYEDGGLKFSEEYDGGKLISGKYFRKGETRPAAVVEGGQGMAILYEENGAIGEKIEYIHGEPFNP